MPQNDALSDDSKLGQVKIVIGIIVVLIVSAVAANLYFTNLFVSASLEVSRLEDLTQSVNQASRVLGQLRSPVSTVIQTEQVDDERRRYEGYFTNLSDALTKADSLLHYYPERQQELAKTMLALPEIEESAGILFELVEEGDLEGAEEERVDGFEIFVIDNAQEPLQVLNASLNELKEEALAEVDQQQNNPKFFNLITASLMILILIVGGRSIIVSYRRVQAAQRETSRALQGTQDILDTVNQGLVTIEKDGKVRPQMSAFTRNLFDGRDIPGRVFYELFYPSDKPDKLIEFDWGEGSISKAAGDLIQEWRDWIAEFAFNPTMLDDIPFSEDILPQAEITIEEQDRIIAVSGGRIYEDKNIAGVMVNLTDITALKRAEAEKRSSIGLIGAAAKDKDGFMRLLGGLRAADELLEPWTSEEGEVALKFAEDMEAMENGVPVDQEQANAAFRAMHTQKADSKIFMADDIVKAIHRLEEVLKGIQEERKIDMDTFGLLGERRAQLNKDINTALDLLKPVLGEDIGTVKGAKSGSRSVLEVRIPIDEIEKLAVEIDKAGMEREIVSRVRSMVDVEAVTMLRRFEKMVADLSEKLDKRIDYVTENVEQRVPVRVLDLAMDALVHIVRNAVDHGIENVEDRLEAGKSERATVKLAVTEKTDDGQRTVGFQVTDDGRGVSPEVIGQVAVKKGVVSSDELGRMSEEEILRLIFRPGFSTKEAATDVSGRGIGLDVAVDNIENTLGGRVTVDSTPGKGSVFSIVVPVS